MSRIGNKPIPIPSGVTVRLEGRCVHVEGKLGKLSRELRPEVDVVVNSEPHEILVTRKNDARESRAFHGLTRSLVANMVEGVTQGYEKRLEIVGVGYVAAVQNNQLQMRVGYANEVRMPIPVGLEVICPDTTHVVVKGCDKQRVGQFAAEARASRKPEPYKGKGVRYHGEKIKIKPGKSAQ